MFWKWKSEESSSGTKEVAPVATDQFEAALDTVALFLRVFGQKSFDTDASEAESTREHFEQLATRIVMGVPRTEASPVEENRGTLRRDWATVRAEVSRHRSHEQEYVVRSLSNLRAAVQAFVRSLTGSISEDRASDDKVSIRLDRLTQAVKRNDSDAIRLEACGVAELVRDSIARRRDRERSQLLVLGQRVRELRDELAELRQKASLDPLTKLFNRAAFDDEVDRVAALGLLLGNQPCLLMVDIDHFKLVNDEHGHQTGDHVLRVVADTLVRNFLRKEDFVARYGGEEFAVVVPNMSLESVASRAERTRQVVEGLDFSSHRIRGPITLSVGIAPLIPGESCTDWIERADRALYAAKHGGRNRVVVANCETGELCTFAATPTPPPAGEQRAQSTGVRPLNGARRMTG